MLRSVSSHFGLSKLTGAVLGISFLFSSFALLSDPAFSQSSVRPPSNAAENAQPADAGAAALPANTGNLSNSLGSTSQSDFWRALREGQSGQTQITGQATGQAMRAPSQRLRGEAAIREAAKGDALSRVTSPNLSGAGFAEIRNGPLPRYGAYVLGGMLALIALFYLIRGRVRVEHGLSGFTVTRFMTIERAAHWLLAVSFIILALTGLSVTYGKIALSGFLGRDLFATIAAWGKFLHNYVAFAFMAGLAMIFVFWVKDNLLSRFDLNWIAKGGGLFSKNSHPPAKKFNFGQKIIFWAVIIGGISISLSGIALMFPFQTTMFGKTLALFGLASNVTPVAEQQLASLWHAAMAIFLVAIIFGHIYIGTVGMEGAFDAMGSGDVDVNWAKEHHSLWYEEVAGGEQGRRSPGSDPAPAPAE